jgi:phage terminase small subunit
MQRGRKSAAELSVVPIDAARKPVEPPADLKPQEAAIFRDVVASCDPTHFRKSDVPILAALCTATYLSRFYAGQIGEDATAFKNYVETTKLVISLSTKLRLTPQARISAKAVGRQEPPRDGPAPWEYSP